jgi:predicted RNase H-like nuclease (RuvC/YqgF family)
MNTHHFINDPTLIKRKEDAYDYTFEERLMDSGYNYTKRELQEIYENQIKTLKAELNANEIAHDSRLEVLRDTIEKLEKDVLDLLNERDSLRGKLNKYENEQLESTYSSKPDLDKINPKHYKSHPSGIECIEITEHMNFCLGNATKYIWRAGLKESSTKKEDLLKAIWYIQRELAKE